MKKDIDFLKKVRELAVEKNMTATSKSLKIPVYTLRARLLRAATNLGEIPPQFAKTRVIKKVAKSKKSKLIDTVRAAGKAGSAKRIIIPQYIFEELGWKKGEKVVIRRSGKSKIIVEKWASK